MADKWPLANGNWSTAANWNGGTLPVDGDDIYLDNRTITLDQTINLPNSRLLTTARSGGTAGGTLTPTSAFNISLLAVLPGSSHPINITLNYSGTISIPTVNGSSTTGSVAGIYVASGIHNFVLSGCTFIGGVIAGNRVGLWLAGGSGTITFSNCTATAVASHGIICNGGSQLLTGTLNLSNTASSITQAVNIGSNATTAIMSGVCVANGSPPLLVINPGSSIQYTCTAFTWGAGLTNASAAVFAFATATVTNILTLPAMTMHGLSAPVLVQTSLVGGKVCVYGDITSGTGSASATVFAVNNGTVERFGEDICGNAATANSLAALGINSNAFYVVDRIRCSASGVLVLPTGPGVRFKSTSRIIAQTELGATVTIQAPAALLDLPVPNNVRQGISYNNGTQVGTYNAGSEIAADVWSYATRTITAGGGGGGGGGTSGFLWV